MEGEEQGVAHNLKALLDRGSQPEEQVVVDGGGGGDVSNVSELVGGRSTPPGTLPDGALDVALPDVVAPDAPPAVALDAVPDVALDVALLDVAPDVAPDGTLPGVAPDGTLSDALDALPDVALSDVAPAVALSDSAPDGTLPDSAPVALSVVAPDVALPDSAPDGTLPVGAPVAPSDEALDALSESVLEACEGLVATRRVVEDSPARGEGEAPGREVWVCEEDLKEVLQKVFRLTKVCTELAELEADASERASHATAALQEERQVRSALEEQLEALPEALARLRNLEAKVTGLEQYRARMLSRPEVRVR